jgi:hypothetical protein
MITPVGRRGPGRAQFDACFGPEERPTLDSANLLERDHLLAALGDRADRGGLGRPPRAMSMSASRRTSIGFLPPNPSEQPIRHTAARSTTRRPLVVDPVNPM